MPATMLAIEAPGELIGELRAKSAADTVFGEPTLAESPVDSLNTSLNPQNVKEILEVCVVAFQAGTALIVFAQTLCAAIRSRPGAKAILKDPTSGDECLTVDGTTTPEQVVEALREG